MPDLRRRAPRALPDGGRPRRGGLRALVIDDDEHVRVLAEWVFRSAGDEVSVVASGQEGLLEAARLRPDVILLDFHLDDACGADVLDELQRNAATRGIPVIFLTARDPSRGARELDLPGALGVISKPFRPDRLRETVHAMVRGR